MPVRNGLLLYELRRSNCLPESIATGPALLGPLRSQRCLADARREPPSAVLILFYSGEKKPVFADRFLKMVGERGLGLLRKSPSGRCVRNVVSLRSAQPSFGGSHPLLFRRKKTCLCRQVSKNGRRERIRTSDPLVPNQLRYQAALLADGGACYCSPQEASTAFCAFPPNRLESRRPASFMPCREKLPYRYSAFDAVPAGA